MRSSLPLLLILSFTIESTTGAAVRSKEAKYIGGTIATLAENTAGKTELAESAALFTAEKGPGLTIPYQKVESFEYG